MKYKRSIISAMLPRIVREFIIAQYSQCTEVIMKRKQISVWSIQDQKRFEFYSRIIKKGDIVYDVGANVGLVSKVLIRLGARVVAIEPQKQCVACLQKAFGGNRDYILIGKALGSGVCRAEIMQASVSTIASMSPDWVQSVKKSGRFREYEWSRRQNVDVTTLDALISEHGMPAYIK